MYIKEDYSYISDNKMKLVKLGFAELGVYSIHFDRYFTGKEIDENISQSGTLSREDWGKRCDDFSKHLGNQIKNIVDVLNDHYDIHQITEEKSSTEHYNSNWDLFFYSNRGWNNRDYYDYAQISFNSKRNPEDNLKLKDEVLELIKDVDNTQNVGVRVQYQVVEYANKINKAVAEKCEKLLGKMITHQGTLGKIRVLDEYNGIKHYGFFPKGSKIKFYAIDYAEFLTRDY